MPLDISAPDTSKLNNHFILKEIIDHVRELGDDFPNVDLEELIHQLTQVNGKKCDPEVQLRGFLKVFQNTPMYKEEYRKLEATTQRQLHDFINGGSAADVVREQGFALPPSPAAKHHFKFLDSLRKLFGKTDNIESLERSLKAAKVPLIYENEARSELMEVRLSSPRDDFTHMVLIASIEIDANTGILRCALRELGSVCSKRSQHYSRPHQDHRHPKPSPLCQGTQTPHSMQRLSAQLESCVL